MLKKIVNYFLLFVSCFLLLLTTACSVLQKSINSWKDLTTERNMQEVQIYFTKSKGAENVFFIPVVRKISKDNSIVDGTLKELLLGPTKQEQLKGIMTEIPIGTRLIKIEESEDEILIDLSPQYLTGGGSASVQLRYLQLYKTFRGVTPGKKLYLHVDGKTLKTIGGEGLEVSQPLMSINDYTKKYEKTDGVEP